MITSEFYYGYINDDMVYCGSSHYYPMGLKLKKLKFVLLVERCFWY